MNAEYAGFFDIGMVQRNEANAIIVHGTMCLIRRAALEGAAAGRATPSVEDTDLGLAMLDKAGSRTTPPALRLRLLPDTFEAYKKQRHRWAFGGLQILRRTLATFAAGTTGSRANRNANMPSAGSTGSAPRASASWSQFSISCGCPVVAFARHRGPGPEATLPIWPRSPSSLVAFHRALSLARAHPGSRRQMSARSARRCPMQWTVARAVGSASSRSACPSCAPPRAAPPARAAISRPSGRRDRRRSVIGAFIVVHDQLQASSRDQYVRTSVLMVQSLPFLAAVALRSLIEGIALEPVRLLARRRGQSRGAST